MKKDTEFLIKCRAIILHEGNLLVVRNPNTTKYFYVS